MNSHYRLPTLLRNPQQQMEVVAHQAAVRQTQAEALEEETLRKLVVPGLRQTGMQAAHRHGQTSVPEFGFDSLQTEPQIELGRFLPVQCLQERCPRSPQIGVSAVRHGQGERRAALVEITAGREHYPDDEELLWLEGLYREEVGGRPGRR